MYVAFAVSGDLNSPKRVVLPTELQGLPTVRIYAIQPIAGRWPLPTDMSSVYNDIMCVEMSNIAVIIVEYASSISLASTDDMYVSSLLDSTFATWVNGKLANPTATVSKITGALITFDAIAVPGFNVNVPYISLLHELEITSVNFDATSDSITTAVCDMLDSLGSSPRTIVSGDEFFDVLLGVDRQKIIDGIIDTLQNADLNTIQSAVEQMV